MRGGKRIGVVVPAFKEETQITTVVETMPDFVDDIIVVDDCSPDDTAKVTRALQADHPTLRLIVHEENQGVGAAITTGYLDAIERGCEVIAVMAGDGQMPPDELSGICDPVISGEAEYAKANRLIAGEAWELIPRKRYLGNAVLSFLTKVASGYYNVVDSQTGYTAISAEALKAIDLKAMYPRYGYPNDMLVRLNVARARVRDVPSRPVYGVGEQSKLKVRKVLFTMSWLLLRRFWWRMGSLYIIRDFHPLVLFYTLGAFLAFWGLVLGLVVTGIWIAGGEVTGATAVLVSLLLQSGLLLTLFGMLFDFQHNRHLNPDQ